MVLKMLNFYTPNNFKFCKAKLGTLIAEVGVFKVKFIKADQKSTLGRF